MTQKAIFIGLDGVQLEKLLLLGLQDKAPALNGLDIVEAYTGGNVGTPAQQQTVSGPSWSTLLTGVWTDQHGVTDNDRRPINAEVDSIFEYVDAAIPDATIASIINWSDINTGHFAREAGLLGEPPIIDHLAQGLPDQTVTDRAVDLITTVAPDFTFLHFDEPDGVGHSVGFGAAYDQSLIAASVRIGQILDAVAAREAANPNEDWLVIVATDHGRDPVSGSGHGAQTEMERRVFVAANKELATFDGPVPATSVVATILDHMGIDFTLAPDGLQTGSLLDGAADPIPPRIAAFLTPVDDAARVARDLDLSVRFTEPVVAGGGTITLLRADDDSVVATVDVTSDSVVINGDVVTIDLPVVLDELTEYYVRIDAGAFSDGTNDFFGLTDSDGWNFITEADLQAPQIISLTPGNGASGIATGTDLTIVFDEAIQAGTGDIVVRRADDDSVFETVAVNDPRVRIDGDTMTVDLSGTLDAGTAYYVEVDAGAVRDMARAITLFTEDFDSVPLGPFVTPSEKNGTGADFSETPPEGWVKDNTDTPTGGPVEYFGWTVLNLNSWIASADDQSRSSFTNASGGVLVADGDEYDDWNASIGPNLFNVFVTTPVISLEGIEAGSLTVSFDSSWRFEGTQTAALEVSYDGGATWTQELIYSSERSSPHFKPDATNESIRLELDNPEGAGELLIKFGLFDTGNNWWWAIDNVVVQGEGAGASGNPFAGVDDKAVWTFTTEAGAAEPALPALLFRQGASGTPIGTDVEGPEADAALVEALVTVDAQAQINGARHTLVENTGIWNALKSVETAAGSYDADQGTAFAFANFVDVRLDYAVAGQGLDLLVVGARRGEIAGGAGDDAITWAAHSNGYAGWSDDIGIDAGAGDDVIEIRAVASSDLDEALLGGAGNGADWNAAYDGRHSTAVVDGGDGNDLIRAFDLVRLIARGGAGDDVGLGGASDQDVWVLDGAAGDYLITEADGAWTIRDQVGTDGTDVVTGFEYLRYGNGETVALNADLLLAA